MDKEKASFFEVCSAALVGLFFIVSLIYCSLIFEVPGRGRLWDKLASGIPRTAAIATAQSTVSTSKNL